MPLTRDGSAEELVGRPTLAAAFAVLAPKRRLLSADEVTAKALGLMISEFFFPPRRRTYRITGCLLQGIFELLALACQS